MDAASATCLCRTLDRATLVNVVDEWAADPTFYAEHLQAAELLYADVGAFVEPGVLAAMEGVVAAVEAAVAAPPYIAAALDRAPPIAASDPGPHGVFMGYDFHLDTAGVPRLIEVNTNAGGGYLAAAGALAHRRCCAGDPPDTDFRERVWAMFVSEWRAQRGEAALRRVAIVDRDPREQFLHPEFELARRHFEQHGVAAVVVDPRELEHTGGALRAGGAPVDLVYCRLTDFYLEDPEHHALRSAFEADEVVLTPSPRHHALYADKRNLVILSDEAAVATFGLDADAEAALATIPSTEQVTPENADAIHARRKELFFKPYGGHGSKGVYRGAKITRRVWDAIRSGGYVAQAQVPPQERPVRLDGDTVTRKVDLRLYTYRGRTLLAAARLYQGQTTNFRTPGGGFAPLLPAGHCPCARP